MGTDKFISNTLSNDLLEQAKKLEAKYKEVNDLYESSQKETSKLIKFTKIAMVLTIVICILFFVLLILEFFKADKSISNIMFDLFFLLLAFYMLKKMNDGHEWARKQIVDIKEKQISFNKIVSEAINRHKSYRMEPSEKIELANEIVATQKFKGLEDL